MKSQKNLPFVTYIVPTYNAEKFLPLCLESIKKQNYPRRKYEVFVIDGGSTDDTINIVKKFKFKLISNPKRDQETAKSIGIKQSKGEIIILLDADNEIIKKDWLNKMVQPLLSDPELFGVESLYFPKKGESIFNTYSMLAHIADPFTRCMATRLQHSKKTGYIEYTIPGKSPYPLGANGFLWRKSVIKEVGHFFPMFEESNFSYFALEKGHRKFARVSSQGIYHYHINSLGDFVKKRLKIGNKFLNRKVEKKRTWLEGVSNTKYIFCIIYCATFIGPLIEGVYNFIKTKNKAWLLHPILAYISVVCYGYVFVKRRLVEVK